MGKHKQKSKRKNPQRRAAEKKGQIQGAEIDQIWLDEASSIPEDVELKTRPEVFVTWIVYSTVERVEIDWIKETVALHFKRAEHGI